MLQLSSLLDTPYLADCSAVLLFLLHLKGLEGDGGGGGRQSFLCLEGEVALFL